MGCSNSKVAVVQVQHVEEATEKPDARRQRLSVSSIDSDDSKAVLPEKPTTDPKTFGEVVAVNISVSAALNGIDEQAPSNAPQDETAELEAPSDLLIPSCDSDGVCTQEKQLTEDSYADAELSEVRTPATLPDAQDSTEIRAHTILEEELDDRFAEVSVCNDAVEENQATDPEKVSLDPSFEASSDEEYLGGIGKGCNQGPCITREALRASLKEAASDVELIAFKDRRKVFDWISMQNDDPACRRYTVRSVTDHDLNQKQTFGAKQVLISGPPIDFQVEGIGFACKKGLKPESPNQDSFIVAKLDGVFAIYGVFDGHGRKGHDISDYVKETLTKVILAQSDLLSDPPAALERAFARTQELVVEGSELGLLSADRSGSTATVVFHDLRSQVLHVAHVGDSRCVMGRTSTQGDLLDWQALDMTVDHKPDMPEEKARIEKAGGQVSFDGGWNHRVYVKGKRYPGLNMSRSIGDIVGSTNAGISSMPTLSSQVIRNAPPTNVSTVDELSDARPCSSCSSSGSFASMSSHPIDPSVDRLLLLCSDGIWEFLSSEDAVKIVSKDGETDPMVAAERLAAVSWDRWVHELKSEVVDDITVLLINLSHSKGTTSQADVAT